MWAAYPRRRSCTLRSCSPKHSTLLSDHGVKTGGVKLDLKTMMARKNKVVEDLTKGIEFLFKKNKVESVQGFGKITAPGKVEVKPVEGARRH